MVLEPYNKKDALSVLMHDKECFKHLRADTVLEEFSHTAKVSTVRLPCRSPRILDRCCSVAGKDNGLWVSRLSTFPDDNSAWATKHDHKDAKPLT